MTALTDSIARMATGTYMVTRFTAASYTSGRLNSAATTSFEVSASVQPMGTDDLMRTPEGMRTRELRQVFCTALLSSGTVDVQPDLVSIDGASWEVQSVENWLGMAGYCRAIVARVEGQ
jgi:hypothetical protein